MKVVALAVFLAIVSQGLVSSDQLAGTQMKKLVAQLNKLQEAQGAKGSNLYRILGHVSKTLGQASDQQSLFIASDDGKMYSGGLIGNLIGALLGTVGYILGGDQGLCGDAHGLVMQQHGGVLGGLLDLIAPITGSLGNGGGPNADKGLLSDLLNAIGIEGG